MPRPFPSVPPVSVGMLDENSRVDNTWYDYFRGNTQLMPVRGSATFASSTSLVVSLPAPELSNDYNIHLDQAENNTFWVTSKTTSSFTANASAATSSTLGWTLIRR